MRPTCRKALLAVQMLLAFVLAAPFAHAKKATSDAAAEALAFADRKCLTEGLYFEAGSEGRDGMVGVAEVIFRRAITPGYPKTVCKVVYNGAPAYGCQFSFACDGARVRPRSKALWKATWALAGELLADREAVLAANTTLGALRFHADYVSPDWESEGFEPTVQIGRHIFYAPKPTETAEDTAAE